MSDRRAHGGDSEAGASSQTSPAEPHDTAVTEAIVAMSGALSLRGVGEGAGTERQVTELARLGCDFVQGFHFSEAVPAEEITQMLAEGPAWLGRRARP